MIPGTNVDIGGKSYTLPPINLRIYFDHEADLAIIFKPEGNADKAYVTAVQNVLIASIQRNYPDFGEAEAMEINYPDIGRIVKALLSNAGFTQSPLESGAKAQVANEPPEANS